MVTGKFRTLWSNCSCADQAIKTSAGIDKDTKLIEPEVVKPIQSEN
ncbi:MAG: hypothetical protein ACLS5K_05070 [Streptococcus salivarius]